MLKELVEQFRAKNKTNLFKEIKEIRELTSNKDEEQGLFSVNIIVEILLKEVSDLNKKKLSGYEEQLSDTVLRSAFLNFIASPLVLDYIFEKESFLQPYIKEDRFKLLCEKMFNKSHIMHNVERANVDDIKKYILKEYEQSSDNTMRILESFNFQLNLLSVSMKNEDFFINQLDKELLKIRKATVVSLTSKKVEFKQDIFWDEETYGITALSSEFFKEILKMNLENRDLERTQCKFFYVERKYVEWKQENRERKLLEILESKNCDKKVKVKAKF